MGLEKRLGSGPSTGLMRERVTEGVREGIKDEGLTRMCSKLKRRLEGGLETDGQREGLKERVLERKHQKEKNATQRSRVTAVQRECKAKVLREIAKEESSRKSTKIAEIVRK